MSEWMIGKTENLKLPFRTEGYRKIMMPLIRSVGIDITRNLDHKYDSYSVKVREEAYVIASEILNDE